MLTFLVRVAVAVAIARHGHGAMSSGTATLSNLALSKDQRGESLITGEASVMHHSGDSSISSFGRGTNAAGSRSATATATATAAAAAATTTMESTATAGWHTQLTETVAVGKVWTPLFNGHGAGHHEELRARCREMATLVFSPAGSTATVSADGSITPDVPGSYVIELPQCRRNSGRGSNGAHETGKSRRQHSNGVGDGGSVPPAARVYAYLRAVDLTAWSTGSVLLMADKFGTNTPADTPVNSASGYGFWEVINASVEADSGARMGMAARRNAASCRVLESASAGLQLLVAPVPSASASPARGVSVTRGVANAGTNATSFRPITCGLATRAACPYGSAAAGCGYSSGRATVNPFADHVLVSLIGISTGGTTPLPATTRAESSNRGWGHAGAAEEMGAGALWLTSTHGAIALQVSATSIDLGWAANASAASQLHSAGGGGTSSNWTTLASVPLPTSCMANSQDGNGSGSNSVSIHNLSISLSISTFGLAATCGGHPVQRLASGLHGINWRTFAADTAGELGVVVGSVDVAREVSNTAVLGLRGFSAVSVSGHGHMPAVLAPLPNLNGMQSEYLGASHAPNMSALGYLDPTRPPFDADPTGNEDATVALQAAVEYSRRNYLALWLPPSSVFRVTDTIVAKETNRLDAVDGSGDYWQQGRYAPVRWVGSSRGKKPVLVLPSGTFTNASSPKPVVWYWYQSGAPEVSPPPYSGGTVQPNANCNQIFQGIDIRIEPGNPGAMGIRARGAQMMVVQDVTIYAGDGLVGLSGGAGSGGSHYGVTVVGGSYGLDLTTAQPGPTLTGITLINQSCSALVYSGLQTLTAVGLRIEAHNPLAQPAVVTGCAAATNMPPDWGGTLFGGRCLLPQFVDPHIIQPCIVANSGALTMVDSVIEFGTWAAAPRVTATAVAAAASLYLANVHVKNAATLAAFHGGETLDAPSRGTGVWSVVDEYAHGVWHQTQQANASSPHLTSWVHVFDAATMAPLAREPSAGPFTTMQVGVTSSATPPDASLTAKHLYNGADPRSDLPSFESPGGILASDFGASPFGVSSSSVALEQALAAAAAARAAFGSTHSRHAGVATAVVVLGRGVFRVDRTLVIPPGVSVVGAGLHLTSIVPTSTGFPAGPVVKATGGGTVLAALSVSPWAHYDDVTAVEWGAGVDSLWYQVHVNRMTECGIAQGTPLQSREVRAAPLPRAAAAAAAAKEPSAAPAVLVPQCQANKKLDSPLVLVTGSGSFYNFYNEDAMGNMVASDYQLPGYRHILVYNTSGVRFYHFNPEHTVANANSEFRLSSNISVFGTKSEGHSATIWVRNCTDIFHTGHGGNAFPASCDPSVCPSWHPSPCACNWTAGAPSLFRSEDCRGNCRFGNLWSQTAQGGAFAAFHGTGAVGAPGRAIDAAAQTTGPYDAPVLVAISSTLNCAPDPAAPRKLMCERSS